MTRFTKYCRVIFVEPPTIEMVGAEMPERSVLRKMPDDHGVQILEPTFPETLVPEYGESYEQQWRILLPEVLAEAGANTVLWTSSPLADYLVAQALNDVRFAVYDCMDDLASFKDGTTAMRVRERYLMEMAELVFTGGVSMYEARKVAHPRVYCFPSGVDVEHYGQCTDGASMEPQQVAGIPHPRLGYFGVLDERIDWPLIKTVAERRPEWHWLLVGPTVKVEQHELPTASNIHYLGQQPYEALPRLLQSFDVATMPFALNEATRFISPTKTLEYLAGGKQVISSSVPDVVAGYNTIVRLADGADAWISAVEGALHAPQVEQEARMEQANVVLKKSSWDSIVEQMWGLIEGRL
ncbi:MAG: glycosyltransferase family 1 protein [Herpetosiphon sp.]